MQQPEVIGSNQINSFEELFIIVNWIKLKKLVG